MRIAYVISSLVNRGPVVVLNNIVRNFLNGDNEVHIYYFDDEKNELVFPCPVYCIKKTDIIPFDKYDIIHSHTFRADYYLYRNRKKIKFAKIVSTIHQDTFVSLKMDYNIFTSFFITAFWCHIYRQFDGVVAISNQIQKKYNKFISGKLVTIYNGCDIQTNPEDERIGQKISDFRKKGSKVLCSYAYITKKKGLSQVIEALVDLKDYTYIIIGDGPYLNDLKREAKELGVYSRILFLPFLNAPYRYLKYVDVYMMPSYSEGFGLAMVEAALQSTAIVCSNLDSFNELFSKNEVVFFTLDDKTSLIQAIERAYTEKLSLGEKANFRAASNFTSAIMASNYLKYYKEITNRYD